MALNTRSAALGLGLLFLLVGALGFVPNPVVSPDGLFAVNAAHNLLHLASGLVLIAGALTARGAGAALQIVGWVYIAVALLGFVLGGDMLFGLVRLNAADRWLHVVLAMALVAAAYLLPERAERS